MQAIKSINLVVLPVIKVKAQRVCSNTDFSDIRKLFEKVSVPVRKEKLINPKKLNQLWLKVVKKNCVILGERIKLKSK
jgi:hypothetical protein